MSRTILIAASLLSVMSTAVLADTIDRRQAHQGDRIEQGRRSGEITVLEGAKLRAEQAKIRGLENRAKSDGVVTRSEAREIDRAQDAASRHIKQEAHDSQKSWFRR